VNTAERLSTGKGYIDFKCVTMFANKKEGEKQDSMEGERERERERFLKKRLRNSLNNMSRRSPTSVLVHSAKLFHHGFRLSTQGPKCDTITCQDMIKYLIHEMHDKF
jgi:hypothetical protein